MQKIKNKITLSNLRITVEFSWVDYYKVVDSFLNPGLYSIEFFFLGRRFEDIANWTLPAAEKQLKFLREHCKKEKTNDN